jgi:1,4-dihydroxy-2-naphthoyl-CoA synthase
MKNQNNAATNLTEIRLAQRSPTYWRVTFDHPPLNIFGPETAPQLNEIVKALETDEHVKVVVLTALLKVFFSLTTTSLQGSGVDRSASRTNWTATASRYAGAVESGPGCVDRVNSGARDRYQK